MSPRIHYLQLLVLLLAFAGNLPALTIELESLTFEPTDGSKPITIHEAVGQRFGARADVIAPPHYLMGRKGRPIAVFERGQTLQVRATYIMEDYQGEELTAGGGCDLFMVGVAPVEVKRFEGRHRGEAVIAVRGYAPNTIGCKDAKFYWSCGNTHGELDIRFCTVFKRPDESRPVFRRLVEWSCEHAADLSDEKQICDALISSLQAIGVEYGQPGWSTLELILNKGGMCGGFSIFFKDYCNAQGVPLSCWFFTLSPGESGWSSIDIMAPGVNAEHPSMSTMGFFVEERYPQPKYYGYESLDDDVDVRQLRMYRFEVPYDGHCVNLLKYDDQHFMYDPSFAAGPFSGFFSDEVPEEMTGLSLSEFRQSYFDSYVDHLQGNVFCEQDASGLIGREMLDIRTSLVPSNELKIIWEDITKAYDDEAQGYEMEEGETFDWEERVDTFNQLYGIQSLGNQKKRRRKFLGVDYGLLMGALEHSDRKLIKRQRRFWQRLLSSNKRMQLSEGSKLPGVLPPRKMLKAGFARWSQKDSAGGFQKTLRQMRNKAGRWFRTLLDRKGHWR